MAKMNGLRFEDYCADILRRNGYKHVQVTRSSGDQGVDVLASRKGKKYAVQCKYYSGAVGNKAVQEVMAGQVYYNCDAAIVMTNSTFTKSAKELAEKAGVELWDRIKVKKGGLLNRLLKSNEDDILASVQKNDVAPVLSDYEKWAAMDDTSSDDVQFDYEKGTLQTNTNEAEV